MQYIIMTIAAILLAGGAFFIGTTYQSSKDTDLVETATTTPNTTITTATSTATSTNTRGDMTVIGTSRGGHEITAYHFGNGDEEILFIGGIHGGYSPATNLVAYELIDHLKENPSVIPNDVTITVIPTLNPDGLLTTTGTTSRFTSDMIRNDTAAKVAGRFNSRTVDLNRNFDCDWAPESKWQERTVSGGSAPFSEPETAALKNYVGAHKPAAVIAWYSAEGALYASACDGKTASTTATLVAAYADASSYEAKTDFDAYPITGDMMNWFAKQNVPAISVLLSEHDDTEWNKNWAGIAAILQQFQ